MFAVGEPPTGPALGPVRAQGRGARLHRVELPHFAGLPANVRGTGRRQHRRPQALRGVRQRVGRARQDPGRHL